MHRIFIKGAVQGVGFRPAVYRIAKKLGLNGYVRNVGSGEVEIVIDGKAGDFIHELKNSLPPLARIDDMTVEETDSKIDHEGFKIVESSDGKKSGLSLPPPDTAVCELCRAELMSEDDRRHGYPFISCTACGPRFTILRRLPMDRENTSLARFKLCEKCEKEYKSVEDRRYYAQTIACSECGPNYTLITPDRKISGWEGIRKACKMLDHGKILAIKGVGGYHIACITQEDVVKRLRRILKRPQQPFALMVRDMECVKKLVRLKRREEDTLISSQRPIVVLKKRNPRILDHIAPGLDTLGIMLPYAPVHHLLFDSLENDALIMTSANMPGEPMYIDEEIMKNLRVDAYLIHNLKIENRCDDSVIKSIPSGMIFVRRSRGFVPEPIPIESGLDCISTGAELYNSFCVVKEKNAFLSQYIGDTEKFRTYEQFFKPSVEFFFRVLKPEVRAVICDLHPLYNTSRFAEKISKRLKVSLFRVQHHFAHGLSVMAEYNLKEAVAIVCDGTGYGFDGKSWGGEVLSIDFEKNRFMRLGHIEEFALIGGDLAAKYPLRVLYSLLYPGLPERFEEEYSNYLRDGESFQIFERQLKSGIGVSYSSSAGRVMDAVSSLLKICFERTYEGEPAMKLESMAERCDVEFKPEIKKVSEKSAFSSIYVNEDFDANKRSTHVLKVSKFVGDLSERFLDGGEPKSRLAYQAIAYVADGLGEIARKYAEMYDLPIVVSGGVAYNEYFIERLLNIARDHNIRIFFNRKVAAGDNGIALGQAYLSRFLRGDELHG